MNRDVLAGELVRYATVPAMPWKNGLGLTRQLAIHPPHASAAAFEWRVSIAQLTGTAPFSQYAGITRCLVVLEGALRLQFADRTVFMTVHSRSLEFSGEARLTGVVEQVPALDLNVMWQAGRWRCALARLAGSEGVARFQKLAAPRMLCSLAQLRVQCANQELTLGRYDLLRSDGEFTVDEPESFAGYGIELQPA